MGELVYAPPISSTCNGRATCFEVLPFHDDYDRVTQKEVDDAIEFFTSNLGEPDRIWYWDNETLPVKKWVIMTIDRECSRPWYYLFLSDTMTDEVHVAIKLKFS
jgi:hypothetical protein